MVGHVTLLREQEPGAHRHAVRTERQRGHQPLAIVEPTGTEHHEVREFWQNAVTRVETGDTVPRSLNSPLLNASEATLIASHNTQRELGEVLDRIAEPATAEAALKTCEEIDRLESDADRVMRSAMSKLFREEADVREVIKLKAIYELLETITDKCEDVANQIEGIVLENS